MRLALTLLALAVIGLTTGCRTAPTPKKVAAAYPGLTWTHTERQLDGPVHLAHVRLDLHHPAWTLDVVCAPDPDGTGPAETVLLPPTDLMRRGGLAFGMNANAYWPTAANAAIIPDAHMIQVGAPVDVRGLLVHGGTFVSEPEHRYYVLWRDRDAVVHIGQPTLAERRTVVAGVAGRQWIVQNGEIIASANEANQERHPRAAAGLDASGRYLHLIAIDVRFPHLDGGATLEDVALTMVELGCVNVIEIPGVENVMYLMDPKSGTPVLLNSPLSRAYGTPADLPVPGLFGMRRQSPPRTAPAAPAIARVDAR